MKWWPQSEQDVLSLERCWSEVTGEVWRATVLEVPFINVCKSLLDQHWSLIYHTQCGGLLCS